MLFDMFSKTVHRQGRQAIYLGIECCFDQSLNILDILSFPNPWMEKTNTGLSSRIFFVHRVLVVGSYWWLVAIGSW